MKRPPGIWILLSAGVLWLSLQDVYGIRGTALIFAKSTTTTPGPVPNVTDGLSDTEVVTESSSETNNVTKPTLTGNPQIDYVHDPNLPKELNGYNLSAYPFYERVPDPEEIDFKCDGLHDGFYASIAYKCQVYHHCLFGTRYDFLCANYTAFDQKTFICQFVSDVDCVGSKKFWHRNDALYVAATTTTAKPLNIYTPPPQPNPVLSKAGGRAGGKRKRPLQRRPQYDYYDYADYEDDYYEDRPRPRKRQRPRPRPRPVYDDYEEDYEEDGYERRNRRPYNRRGGSDRRRNRNKNRESSSEDDIEKPKGKKKFSEDDDEVHRSSDRRKPLRDDEFEEETRNERRKPSREDHEDERPNDRRKPQRDDDFDEERKSDKRKPNRDDRFEDERPNTKRKPARDDHLEDDYDRPFRPRKSSRRPTAEDDYEDREDVRGNRPRKKYEDEPDIQSEESKPLIKPTTGTIYDRPRVAPRIKPPVPKNEANKYAYKPISKVTTASPLDDYEYYDDYEEDLPAKSSKSRKTEVDPIKPKSSENKERKQTAFSSRSKPKKTLDEEDDALTLPVQAKTKVDVSRGKDRYRNRSQPRTTEPSIAEESERPRRIGVKRTESSSSERDEAMNKKIAEPEYYDDDYEIKKMKDEFKATTEAVREKWKPSTASSEISTFKTHKKSTTTRSTTTTTSTTVAPSTTENFKERPEQIVRIVKRPFLPSRGGNPYSARGLQPVGFKAAKAEVMEQQSSVDVHQKSEDLYTDEPSSSSKSKGESTQPRHHEGNTQQANPINKGNYRQKPPQEEVLSKPYINQKFSEPISDNDDNFKPIKRPQHISRPSFDENSYSGPRTTQRPKVPERNPLDITENEYDVTLNDALNPTLPNLPVRSNYPTGFSPANDYTFSAFQRPRYVLEPVISSANADYVYQPKPPAVRQRFEGVPQSYSSRDQFVAPSNDYKNFNPPVSGYPKRGITQAQSQSFYATSY